MKNKKIIILASGKGSNAQAILEQCQNYNFSVSAIVTDNANAGVIKVAQNFKIACEVVVRPEWMKKDQHEELIIKHLMNYDFNLIVLAGYQRVLSSHFLSYFPPNSILNIHPSLLPKYAGRNAYEQTFDSKDDEAGISIHYVDRGVDTGPLVFQKKFLRDFSDSFEQFQNKGLKVEHEMYTKIIAQELNQSRTYRLEVYPVVEELIHCHDPLLPKYFLKASVFTITSECPLAKLLPLAKTVLCDNVVEKLFVEHDLDYFKEHSVKTEKIIEVGWLPGVTDNTGMVAQKAFSYHPDFKDLSLKIAASKMYFIDSAIVAEKFFNPWLETMILHSTQDFAKGIRFNTKTKIESLNNVFKISTISLKINDDELEKLSHEKMWALNLDELKFIKKYFEMQKREPTDVEMEIIAQTWSEHCKHKIFNAEIEHVDDEGKRTINSLFKTFIKAATSRILEERKIQWTRSVFTDNAGIVRWDDNLDVCIKVETHNSPSALDPYAGALTGILGVNRDILGCGIGALPIANTNVFCLPPIESNLDDHWPKELHSPVKLRSGVHKGVQDGGNKSGIPTVNGAFFYDQSYAGKPLVYCGTVGVIPRSIQNIESHEKNQMPHDFIVMVGGRVGKDGIHGATFSSMELSEGMPSTVVQLGDPMTQKKVTDFLIQARNKILYSSITDNGAGGLSSSVGEMAQKTNGAVINLENVPLKYQGLSLSDIVISESQERMTCSVKKEKLHEFLQLAKDFDVEATVIGQFTNDGHFCVKYQNQIVANLNLNFLFEQLPQMKLYSKWDAKLVETKSRFWKKVSLNNKLHSLADKIYALLSSPNIRSHESFVRQYDHEVKAATILKPFSPESGPSDAAILRMKSYGGSEKNGLVISCGLAPIIGLQDPKLMAYYCVDEAVRNALCTGANPKKMALTDNFCWPDPLPSNRNPDYAQKLGALVRCCEGLYEICVELGLPLVSGKDSMKNDAWVNFENKKIKISVLPTLLISLIAHMDDVNKKITASFNAGNDLWWLKPEQKLYQQTLNAIQHCFELHHDKVELKKLYQNYEEFYSAQQAGLILGAHDVSDGGCLIALIEMSINSKLGFETSLKLEEDLFGEGMGMIVFSALPEKRSEIKKLIKDAQLIGQVRNDKEIHVANQVLTVDQCRKAYVGTN